MARKGIISELQQWFSKPFKKGGKNQWKVFVLCFFTALVFWAFNSLNKSYNTGIDFPIAIHYNDSTYISLNKLPKEVRMEVSGVGWNLISWSTGIGVKPLHIELEEALDKENLALANYQGVINDKLGQVRFGKFLRDTLALNFDLKVTKKVNVSIDTSSYTLAENCILGEDIYIIPDSIILTGPESILDKLKDNFQIKLDEQKLDQTFNGLIDIDFRSNPLVSVNRENVNVRMEVIQLKRYNFEREVKLINAPSDSCSLSPKKVDFSFFFPEAKEDLLKPDSLILFADFNNINRNDSSIFIMIEKTGLNLREIEISPNSIKAIQF